MKPKVFMSMAVVASVLVVAACSGRGAVMDQSAEHVTLTLVNHDQLAEETAESANFECGKYDKVAKLDRVDAIDSKKGVAYFSCVDKPSPPPQK